MRGAREFFSGGDYAGLIARHGQPPTIDKWIAAFGLLAHLAAAYRAVWERTETMWIVCAAWIGYCVYHLGTSLVRLDEGDVRVCLSPHVAFGAMMGYDARWRMALVLASSLGLFGAASTGLSLFYATAIAMLVTLWIRAGARIASLVNTTDSINESKK